MSKITFNNVYIIAYNCYNVLCLLKHFAIDNDDDDVLAREVLLSDVDTRRINFVL